MNPCVLIALTPALPLFFNARDLTSRNLLWLRRLDKSNISHGRSIVANRVHGLLLLAVYMASSVAEYVVGTDLYTNRYKSLKQMSCDDTREIFT